MSGAIAAILFVALAQTPPETYAWPLDLPRELTSSFGEYRPGRFHMGIDLRTGPIGKDVHAAADGYVSRIRCSPYGYGKAVYIQFDDGNSAVYAHLDDFAPALRDYVRAAQHAREEYTVDLTVPRGKFPVKKGELIAKSGQTGIGVPHLHYELRDSAGVPINPRLLGVTWPDKTPPVISSVFVYPLSANSFVNGQLKATQVRVEHNMGASQSRVVTVAGRIGFGTIVSDPGVGRSKLGVRRITVSVAGEDLFTVQLDRLSYDHAEDGAVIMKEEDKWRFQALWRDAGNNSESYAVSTGDGIFELLSDQADVTVTAEDYAGNRASETIQVVKDSGPPTFAPGTAFAAWQSSIGFDGYTLRASADFGEPVNRAPTLVIHDPGGTVETPMRLGYDHAGRETYTAGWLPESPVAQVKAYMEGIGMSREEHEYTFVRRGAPAQRFVFGDVIIETAPDSPYGTLGFEVTPLQSSSRSSESELISTGAACSLAPLDLPVDAPITLRLPLPHGDAANRVQIFRREKDKWGRIDTVKESGTASVSVKRLGVYALFDDTTPPAITVLRPTSVLSLPPSATATPRRPDIRIRATDMGSGIEFFHATYNGKWILLAYDPEQDLLEWEQDEDLPAGPGMLLIEVRDYAGNTARRELALTIPGA